MYAKVLDVFGDDESRTGRCCGPENRDVLRVRVNQWNWGAPIRDNRKVVLHLDIGDTLRSCGLVPFSFMLRVWAPHRPIVGTLRTDENKGPYNAGDENVGIEVNERFA